MEMNFFDMLRSILATEGQFRFFFYLWLAVTGFGVAANHMTLKRVRQAATYVGLTLLLFNFAFSYRMLHILEIPSSGAQSAALVMSVLVYISVIGGLLTAMGTNSLTIQQKGWLYRCVTSMLRTVAAFIEERANPVVLLKKLADWAEKQADDVHPGHQIAQLIEAARATNGDT